MESEIIDLHPQPSEVFDVRISVSKELSDHYSLILQKRDDILNDPESEDKTMISILTATTAIIKELAKIQSEVYNSEKFAVLQQIIVNVLKNSDKEVADKVLDALEDRYNQL